MIIPSNPEHYQLVAFQIKRAL